MVSIIIMTNILNILIIGETMCNCGYNMEIFCTMCLIFFNLKTKFINENLLVVEDFLF